MQCPQCRAENREGSRFCVECGASLDHTCPACGTTVSSDWKFCRDCGEALTAPVGAPGLRSSAADVAPAVGEPPEAERRQLTVMFCDLVGSTTLAEHLDPEELRELLAQYQDACANVIDHFDGHIARYVGDGLLVYFGYPQAHEDDAQRAVHAGLGTVDAIRELDSQIANTGVNLAVRIGITTGLVVAGDIGSGERVEEKAIVGETPNLAARLQSLAEPNTVVIGINTQLLVEGLFDCDDLGPQRLKGISQSVNAYRVREESDAPSRFEASATRGLTPLVGREEEISLLLKRWEQAKEGEGQVVLLSGEAGIGKSRIVRDFRERLEHEPHNRVLYYGSPYHQNSAFYPAIDQFERSLRFEKTDNAAGKLGRLEAVLGYLELATADFAPLLASLLSLSANGRYPALELDPAQLKRKTLEAIVGVIRAMSSQQPVLMVVEDVHWIDPSTLELISLLIEQLQSSGFFLLITCRPEFASPWGAHTHITSLTLNRLSRKESAAIIAKVTGDKALPNEVHEQIVAKTDGVPLFIEELTKTVLESDLLHDAGDRYALSGALPPLAIPASLQDSLMARLDRLASVKEVAQLAATLGRTFSHGLLAAVSNLKANALDDALTQLAQAELIYRRGLPPDVTYEFKHALVQETAYQSLLKSTRQQYHRQIADVLEKGFPDTTETQPELLAHHYTEAGLVKPAVEHWLRAGQRAAEHCAYVEAIAHLKRGLALVETLPEGEARVRKEIAFRVALGVPLMSKEGATSPEVEGNYQRACELCEEVGESEQLFPVLWGLWFHYMFCSELRTACELADRLLEVGRGRNDVALRLAAHHCQWTSRFLRGELPAALEHSEQGMGLYRTEEHHALTFSYGGHDPGVCARNVSAGALWLSGYAERARERFEAALGLARELGHPGTLADTVSMVLLLSTFQRDGRAMEEQADELLELAVAERLTDYQAIAHGAHGWVMFERGEVEPGLALMRESVGPWLEQGIAWTAALISLVAVALGHHGEVNEGLELINEALRLGQRDDVHWWEAELCRVKGELLLASTPRDTSEAEDCFRQAIDIAQRQGAKSLELRATISLAHVWRSQRGQQTARELLTPIYGWFTEGFETSDLNEAKALLEQLS